MMPFTRKYKIVDTVLLDPQQIMDAQFFDSGGNSIKITDSASQAQTPAKLIVKVEATHSGVNRNYNNYLPEKMQASAPTWTKDYQKPVIMNHNASGDCMKDASDPVGRVVDQEFKQSVFDASKHTILLTLSITDEMAIKRFLDGRYQTFSIGAYTDSITCSICNRDIVINGFCGHRAGKTYETSVKNEDGTVITTRERCIWTMGNFEYEELSIVNSPADPMAVAMSIEVVNDPVLTDAISGSQAADDYDANIINVLDSVDNVLHIGNQPLAQEQIQEQEHIQTIGSIKLPDGTVIPSAMDTINGLDTFKPPIGEPAALPKDKLEDASQPLPTASFNTIEDVVNYVRSGQPCSLLPKDSFMNMLHVINDTYKAYQDNQAMLAQTTAELEAVKCKLITAETKLECVHTSLKEAHDKAAANEITHRALVDQNLTLSRLVQTNLIDHLVTIRVLNNASLDSDSVKAELKTLSTKRLYELIKDESQNLKLIQRPTQLTSPGLSDSNGTDAETPGSNRQNAMDDTDLIDNAVRFLINPAAAMA